MKISLADAFDIAVTRQQMGEPLADILADFPQYRDELRTLLETTSALNILKTVEMPSEEMLAVDRAKFVGAVQNLGTQAVSIGLLERINRWIGQQFSGQKTDPSLVSKEKQPMLNSFFVKAAIVFTMVFGSAGGTMVAAAQSLPDSALYPVKLGLEQARLSLVSDPTAEALLHLRMAQERVDEMVQMAEKGASIDQSVVEQMQMHLDKAVDLANQSPAGEQRDLLTRTQEMLQIQEKNLSQVQTRNKSQQTLQNAQMALEKTQSQLQNSMKNGDGTGQSNFPPNSPIATPEPPSPTETPQPPEPTKTSTHQPPTMTPGRDDATETPEPEDTETPGHQNPTMTPGHDDATETPEPEYTETPGHQNPTMTPGHDDATETPEPEETETPEHQNPTMTPGHDDATETPEPEYTETPEHQNPTMTPEYGNATETPEPEYTETPEPEETDTPEVEETDTPEPEHTETPEHS